MIDVKVRCREGSLHNIKFQLAGILLSVLSMNDTLLQKLAKVKKK